MQQPKNISNQNSEKSILNNSNVQNQNNNNLYNIEINTSNQNENLRKYNFENLNLNSDN